MKFKLDANITGKCMLILSDEEKSTILLDTTQNEGKVTINNEKIDVPLKKGRSYLAIVGDRVGGTIKTSKLKANATFKRAK